MENFLNIPWQQVAINKENAVVRGARASGKTTVAIRWAIKQMRAGKNVAFIYGAVSHYNPVKEMLIRELTRQGVQVIHQLYNLVSIGRGSVMFINAQSNAPRRETLAQECIVIDDADNISVNETVALRLNPRAQYFVTGVRDSGLMSSFLKDEWSPLYVEFNLYHMLEVGFIKENTKEWWAKWDITPREVKKYYGPWREVPNKNNKFVLEKYDS